MKRELRCVIFTSPDIRISGICSRSSSQWRIDRTMYDSFDQSQLANKTKTINIEHFIE